MKKIYIALFLIAIFLVSCAIKEVPEEPKEEAVEEVTTGISDVGEMDEELDVKSLGTLEEDLGFIENI